MYFEFATDNWMKSENGTLEKKKKKLADTTKQRSWRINTLRNINSGTWDVDRHSSRSRSLQEAIKRHTEQVGK